MSNSLTYEKYDKKRLAIYGDRDKYNALLGAIGARWNPKMTTRPGWNLPVEKEEDLKKLIKDLNKENLLKEVENNVESRKTQRRYHRGVSGRSNEDFPEPTSVVVERKKPQKEKRIEKKDDNKQKNITDYYKSFKSRVPKDESSDSEVESSSSEEEDNSPQRKVSSPSDSSEDDFPNDVNIKKNEYTKTLDKIKKLQSKLESLKKFK